MSAATKARPWRDRGLAWGGRGLGHDASPRPARAHPDPGLSGTPPRRTGLACPLRALGPPGSRRPTTHVAQRAGTTAPPTPDDLDVHRAELLLGHRYRMLGSAADAEDAVQETITRAWRPALYWFEGRSSLRTWLYRIVNQQRVLRPVACSEAAQLDTRHRPPVGAGEARSPDRSMGLGSNRSRTPVCCLLSTIPRRRPRRRRVSGSRWSPRPAPAPPRPPAGRARPAATCSAGRRSTPLLPAGHERRAA